MQTSGRQELGIGCAVDNVRLQVVCKVQVMQAQPARRKHCIIELCVVLVGQAAAHVYLCIDRLCAVKVA